MKIVITGVTGNVGTNLVKVLSQDAAVTEIVGLARRPATSSQDKVRFVAGDVTKDNLVQHFRGAAAVVHLAWIIQPSRDHARLHRVNVEGSRRVFEATLAADVPAIVHASSVAAYTAGPKGRRVDETWSTAGIERSLYSCQKAAVEHALDTLEREHPQRRIVRLRSGFTFKRGAASEIRRAFLGRLVSTSMLGRRRLPVVPDVVDFRFQAVHTRDLAQAYRAAVMSDARGAFNIAAEPVIDGDVLAHLFHARKLRLPRGMVRTLGALSYRLRLQPADPGWIDLALDAPLMDMSRAHRELRWEPRRSATEALMEAFEALHGHATTGTPPLESVQQTM